MSGPNSKNVKLTNITNRPNERDVYGNSPWRPGDEFPPFSTRDPAGSGSAPLGVGLGAARAGELEAENPLGGEWGEGGPKFCDTCGTEVNISDLATPSHLGHNIRYGDGKTNFDISNMHKTGGEYSVSFNVKPSDMSFAAKPNQSEDPVIVPMDKEATGPDSI